MGSELVVAGSDASPLLEFGEEGFDAPSLFVGDAVVGVLIFAMAAGWDYRLAALFVDEIVEAVGIVSAIRQNLVCGNTSDQVAGGCYVVLLAGPQNEADR